MGSFCFYLGDFSGFQNVKSVSVEEECVLTEQGVQLRNHRVIIGEGPSFELAQSSFYLCDIQFHDCPRECAAGQSEHIVFRPGEDLIVAPAHGPSLASRISAQATNRIASATFQKNMRGLPSNEFVIGYAGR
ncbi:MAG TPA: hypothetical protein VG168_03140 [Bryobacteraceae bacterium]|nr:hypothetical protein [Bryobacteraceae bacterium]